MNGAWRVALSNTNRQRHLRLDRHQRFGVCAQDVVVEVGNRLDGSVEAMVQGEAHEVNRMVEWARRGPPNAVVTSVDIFPGEGDFVGFQQRELA